MNDFRFACHGNVCILVPISEQAKEWVAIHLPEYAARWLDGYIIEARYANSILEGIADEGLTIS